MQNLILQSKFFAVPTTIEKHKLKRFCELWLPLQAEFTFGIIILTGKLAQELLKSINHKRKNDEEILRYLIKGQAAAAMDELGIGREKSLMHDKTFEQQIRDSGINFELLTTELLLLPNEVGNLRNTIHKAFNDSSNTLQALSMMYVVETIAPELFSAQYKVFSNAGIDDKYLTHSKIHVDLEKTHSAETQDIYLYVKELYSEEVVEKYVNEYSILWKNFLDMLANEVY